MVCGMHNHSGVAAPVGVTRSVHILSGDSPAAVSAVASELGVPSSQAHGGLTPAAKLESIRGIRGTQVCL
jgi:cation transport ATPase